jgi:dTDP-glucose 4,6-dehydratase
MSRRWLVTGADGLAGAHAIAWLLAQGDEVVGMVRAEPRRLPTLDLDIQLVRHDLTQPIPSAVSQAIGTVDVILNLASSTDITRSIRDPQWVFHENTTIVANLAEWVQFHPVDAFVQVSTEEVYGPAPHQPHLEWDPIRPSTHYSASKAAQEAYLTASWRTHGLPLVILNTMNLIGPMQDPAKLGPTIIRRTLAGEQVPLMVDYYEPQSGHGQESLRQYMHPRVLASAATAVADDPHRWWTPRVEFPPRYNVAGTQAGVVELAHLITDTMGMTLNWTPVSADAARPGHERVFALDDTKLRGLGWTPPSTLEDDVHDTVTWYLGHTEWL